MICGDLWSVMICEPIYPSSCRWLQWMCYSAFCVSCCVCCFYCIVFQPYMSRENVLRHLLRLLYFVHLHINFQILNKLIKSIAPSSEVSSLYLIPLFCKLVFFVFSFWGKLGLMCTGVWISYVHSFRRLSCICGKGLWIGLVAISILLMTTVLQ